MTVMLSGKRVSRRLSSGPGAMVRRPWIKARPLG